MLKRYLGSIAVVAIATLAARLFGLVLGVTDIVMVYLAAAVFVAARFGRGPAVLFSFLSCACYNFFFVEPLYTFEMYNRSSWLTLLVMLVTGMVISGQAISLREQEKLARESALEAENERIRNLLLSSVSHDLRTPLAAITGASSGLMSDADSLPRETVRELAGSIHREATRLSHLVSNLLDITKLEAGTVTPNCQPYFIDELVGAALSHTPGLSSHRLETHIEKDLPLVFADGLMIEQVLINLLDNAAKYAPAGTTVTVAAARSGDHVVVRIEDEGPGIPVGDERKVFGKFFRGSRAVGSGLGLAICDGIIRAHHENIWAENRPQGGARFSFTLPVAVSVAEDGQHG